MQVELLLIVVTALHLLAVNLAVGGPVLCLVLHARQQWSGDEAAGQLGRRLLADALWALLLGSLLGLAAWWLVWWRWPALSWQVVQQLPLRRYGFGVAELAFSAVCVGGYGWWRQRRPARSGRVAWWAMAALGVLGTTNLAYHFPPLFAALAMLSTDDTLWNQQLSFLQLAARPEAWSRALHFGLASLAVAGTVAALRVQHITALEAPAAARLTMLAGRWALLPTLAQLVVGVLVLVYLPEASREALLGAAPLAALVLLVSLVASVVLMHKLAAVALTAAGRNDVRQAAVWLLVTVLLMTAVRHYARKPIVDRLELVVPVDGQ